MSSLIKNSNNYKHGGVPNLANAFLTLFFPTFFCVSSYKKNNLLNFLSPEKKNSKQKK